MSKFAERLLAWYHQNKRDLPWRGHPDPYAVWVSEIMLQQTRVEAVVPYFLRWMQHFPTLAALAEAPEREVLKLWEGMGYYARARNLRKAAQVVLQEYGGKLPSDLAELRKLPGIGRYTAGAIASMAFGLDEAALDGNIRRVLARVFDVAEPADSPRGAAQLWKLAEKHLPKGQAADYNQALMDLGATICIAANPRCQVCPVNRMCKARRLGVQTERPVLRKKGAVPHRVVAAAIITRGRSVLLAQRPSTGLLGGMWEFPNGRVKGSPANKVARVVREHYGPEIECGEPVGVVQHTYSHFSVEVHAFRCTPIAVPKRKDLRWVPVGQLGEFPMGRVDRLIAQKLAA